MWSEVLPTWMFVKGCHWCLNNRKRTICVINLLVSFLTYDSFNKVTSQLSAKLTAIKTDLPKWTHCKIWLSSFNVLPNFLFFQSMILVDYYPKMNKFEWVTRQYVHDIKETVSHNYSKNHKRILELEKDLIVYGKICGTSSI